MGTVAGYHYRSDFPWIPDSRSDLCGVDFTVVDGFNDDIFATGQLDSGANDSGFLRWRWPAWLTVPDLAEKSAPGFYPGLFAAAESLQIPFLPHHAGESHSNRRRLPVYLFAWRDDHRASPDLCT